MLKNLSNKIHEFFSILKIINKINNAKPKFIFYSEGKSYLKYAYILIKHLSEKFPEEVYYVSSEVNDKVLDLNVKNIYIGKGFLLQYFFKSINADNVFMTLTDLNNSIIKKNKFVKNYVYFFHSPISTTRNYTSAAFDNYDTILCNGEYQIKEIRYREKFKNLKEKKLIKSGFFYFDYLNAKIEKNDMGHEILVAPSWNKNTKNYINSDFEKIVYNLLEKNYKVRFRPHPETIKRSINYIDTFIKKFQSKNFIYDNNPENLSAMQNAKCLITDNSGISIEYIILFRRPIIFYNDFDKIHNENFNMFKDFEPIEDMVKKKFGYIFNQSQIGELELIIDQALTNFNNNEIDIFLKNYFYNFNETVKYFEKNFKQ